MRRTFLRAVLMTGAAFVSLPFLGAPLAAHDFRAGDLVIDHPWTRAVGASAPTAAGYMVIRNTGAAPDRLVAAETPNNSRSQSSGAERPDFVSTGADLRNHLSILIVCRMPARFVPN